MSVKIRPDLIGQAFGRLLVTAYAGQSKNRQYLWSCKCSCGGSTTVTASNLKNSTKSCGCLRREALSKLRHGNARHGAASKEYRAWQHMKARCYNTTNKDYYKWGGRGIKVCDAWLNSFETFLSGVGPAPSIRHSLDRINTDGDYTPENCKWSTPKEQSINRRDFLTVSQLVSDSAKTASEKGWEDDRTFGDHIALMHSELSEALEEFRNGRGLAEVYYKNDKPEGVPVEFADVIIRIAAFCGHNKIDLAKALHEKAAYNKSRPHRHGGKII